MRINQQVKGDFPPDPAITERIKKMTEPKVRVMIGLPSRSFTCSLSFATSLAMTKIQILSKGWTIQDKTSNNDCFVCCARNNLVAAFMESDCTHLMMIDDDMGWEYEKVVPMIEADKEFICAVGNLKTEDPKYACQPFTDETGIPLGKDGLIWAKGVGGAFTIHKRSLYEKLIKTWPKRKCITFGEKYGYSFFHVSYPEDGFRTEDQNFCDLVNVAGIKIWVYPDMNFKHFGYKEYEGNYHEYLLNLPKPTIPENQVAKSMKLMEKVCGS